MVQATRTWVHSDMDFGNRSGFGLDLEVIAVSRSFKYCAVTPWVTLVQVILTAATSTGSDGTDTIRSVWNKMWGRHDSFCGCIGEGSLGSFRVFRDEGQQ